MSLRASIAEELHAKGQMYPCRACGGTRTPVMKRMFGQRLVYQRQCLSCLAAVGRTIPERKVRVNLLKIPPFIRDTRRVSVQPNHRRRAYSRFMRSAQWRAQRQRVLERDLGCCVHCEQDFDLEVHHKVYADRLEETPDRDLVTLCRDCHREETNGRLFRG